MKNLSLAAISLLFMASTIVPTAAQQRSLALHLSAHAINPNVSLSAPAVSPFEQQTQYNDATQLMQSQRELLQQNPSGTTRQELAIGHALNGFTPTLDRRCRSNPPLDGCQPIFVYRQ
jgi:hypothetical protein